METTDKALLQWKRDQMLAALRQMLPTAEGEEKAHLRRLCEELSSSDWAKIGVIIGILWYKLDRLISAVEKSK